ncbi:hypothetical protein A2U01_0034108, partial [Trifolium medium]|nr:hypothetical protein [Trifolium medium]
VGVRTPDTLLINLKGNVLKFGPDRPVRPVRPGTGPSTGPGSDA